MTDLDLLLTIARCCESRKTMHWQKTPEGPRHVKAPLFKDQLERHLTGAAYPIGLAPIAPGESVTKIGVIDFDSHKGDVPWERMLAIAGTVVAGTSANLFRSSGGQGIHAIFLWREPQDAASVRAWLRSLLARAGLADGPQGVSKGQAEAFPKQDAVAVGRAGNMFILPLAEKSERLFTGDLQWSDPVPLVHREERAPQVVAEVPVDLAELESALAAIPNEGEGLGYDEWRNVVFGIHHATGGSGTGLALAHNFSSRSSKYDPEFLDERVWPYVRRDRDAAVTVRSVFAKARAHGWVVPVLGFQNLDDVPNPGASVPEPSGEAPSAPEPVVPANSTTVPEPARRFRFLPDDEFASRPPPEWIIKGWLPRAEIGFISGESGSGKSFLALEWARAIAAGEAWHGCRVKKGRVAYIAAEGAGGFRNRVKALQEHHGVASLGLHILPAAPNLLQKEEVRELATELRALGPLDVVFIDTWAQVTAGGDENSFEDMGRAVAHAKALHKAARGAMVVIVHHLGKDATKGLRGHSSVHAAADCVIEITRASDSLRTARTAKQKDGADDLTYAFRLAGVTIGTDEDGDPITSCIVQPADPAEARQVRDAPKGDVAKLVVGVLADMADLGGGGVPIGAVLEAVAQRLPVDPEKEDRRRERVRKAIERLAGSGRVIIHNGEVAPC